MGAGAGVAGGRGAGCGDRPPPGGEPVHGAAPSRPGRRAGPAAAGSSPSCRRQAGRPGQRRCRSRNRASAGQVRGREPEPGRAGRAGARAGAGAGRGRAPRAAGPVTARRWPGRASPARSRPGMRVRCCCTPSAAGPGPGRSWPPRRAGTAGPGRGAAVGGQHVLRAGRGDDRAVQAPGRRRRRAAGRAGALPDLRTLRPRLAAIADRTDPRRAAAAVRAPRCWPRTRSSPACITSMTTSSPTPAPSRSGKGWNNKRGKAEKGRADTHVTAHDGRAVCFVTGEPSGLTVTLPKALAELKKAAGPARRSCSGSTGAGRTRRCSGTAATRTCTG